MSGLHNNDFIWNYIHSNEYFQNYGITIHHPGNGAPVMIRGVHMTSPVLNFGIQYQSAASKLAETAAQIGGAAVNKFFGDGAQLFKDVAKNAKEALTGHVNLIDSVKIFQGADSPGIQVTVFVMKGATKASDYVAALDGALRLSSPLLGSSDTVQGAQNYIAENLGGTAGAITGGVLNAAVNTALRPPMDVKASPNVLDPLKMWTSENTCSIQIGKRLRLTHMLCTQFSYTESEVLRDDGDPMYLQLNLSFEPGRALSYQEMRAWFKVLG